MLEEKVSGSKSINEAVKEGSLLDVTELAKKAGMRYPTFISPVLAARWEKDCPGGGVFANISFFVDFLFSQNYQVYGEVYSGWHVCILEPHEEYGHVVLILKAGESEELDLKRTTINHYHYSM